MWENNNAKRAIKSSGVSLMALSLTACGGSDDVAVDITSDNAAAILTAITAVDAAATTIQGVADNAADAEAASTLASINSATGLSLTDASTGAEVIAAIQGTVDITTDNAALIAAAEAAVDITTDNAVLIAAAEAAATTAALTAADLTIYPTIDAAITAAQSDSVATAVAAAELAILGSNANATALMQSNDATVTAAATAAAETSFMSGSGFASVSALLAAYNAEIAGVTALNTVLATTRDVVTGTSNDDTVTGTNLTFNANDVLVGGLGTDTLTVNSAAATVAAAATVTGFETITYNVTSGNLAEAAVTLTNVTGGNVTVNQLANGAAATTAITDAADITLTFGGGITGAATVGQVAASTLVIDAGTAGTVGVTGGTTGSATVTGSAATFVDADVVVTTTGSVTITGGSGLAAIDADAKTINVTTTNASSDITITGTSADATDVATISIGAAAAITNQAAVVETVNISTSTVIGDGTQTVDSVASYDTTAATTYNLTGTKNLVLAGNENMFDGKTVTSSNTGTSTLRLTTMNTSDLEKVAANVTVDLAQAGINHTANTPITVKNNANVLISADLDGTDNGDGFLLTLDSDTLPSAAETLNLTITATQTEVSEATAVVSDFETVNLSTSGATAAVSMSGITGAAGTVFTLATGSQNLTIGGAVTGTSLDATGYTGVITQTVTAALSASATYGSGDDVITMTSGDTVILNGGGGVDTLANTGLVFGTATISNFEVINLSNGANTFASSQLNGSTTSIVASDANDTIAITAAGALDSLVTDLSSLVFNAGVLQTTVTITAGGTLSAALALGGDYSVTGTAVIDNINAGTVTGDMTISTGAGADVIVAGTGDDTITTTNGIDTITTGNGNDTVTLTETVAAADVIIIANMGATHVDHVAAGFTAIAADDIVHLTLSGLNAVITGTLDDTNGTAIVGGTTHTFVEYTVGTALSNETAATSAIKVTNTTGINNFADLNTAIDASNITLSVTTAADFATGEGILTMYYDADDSNLVMGVMESDVNSIFDDGTTFVEIITIAMSTTEYDAFAPANIDLI